VSRAKAPCQERFINWLAKITHDPIVQGAGPLDVIGVSGHENCWNRVACIDEASVKLEAAYHRHLNVADQAGRFEETRRCKEIGSGREDLDRIAQRHHEPSHGVAKVRIILNDRDQ